MIATELPLASAALSAPSCTLHQHLHRSPQAAAPCRGSRRSTNSPSPSLSRTLTADRRGAAQAGDTAEGEAGEAVHEASGAALFVLSLAPAKAVHAATRETDGEREHAGATLEAAPPGRLVRVVSASRPPPPQSRNVTLSTLLSDATQLQHLSLSLSLSASVA
jgi:hypothetical protein